MTLQSPPATPKRGTFAKLANNGPEAPAQTCPLTVGCVSRDEVGLRAPNSLRRSHSLPSRLPSAVAEEPKRVRGMDFGLRSPRRPAAQLAGASLAAATRCGQAVASHAPNRLGMAAATGHRNNATSQLVPGAFPRDMMFALPMSPVKTSPPAALAAAFVAPSVQVHAKQIDRASVATSTSMQTTASDLGVVGHQRSVTTASPKRSCAWGQLIDTLLSSPGLDSRQQIVERLEHVSRVSRRLGGDLFPMLEKGAVWSDVDSPSVRRHTGNGAELYVVALDDLIPIHQWRPQADKFAVLLRLLDNRTQLTALSGERVPGEPHKFSINNGMHRYILALGLGFSRIKIWLPVQPSASAPVLPVSTASAMLQSVVAAPGPVSATQKYVPPHLRRRVVSGG